MQSRAFADRRTASVCLVLAVSLSGRAVSAAAAVDLAATPAALEISKPGSAVPLLLVVRSGDQAITNLKLSFFSDAPVTVNPATITTARVAAGGELAWRV